MICVYLAGRYTPGVAIKAVSMDWNTTVTIESKLTSRAVRMRHVRDVCLFIRRTC